MSTWLVVWIALGAVSTLVVLAFVLALGRHVLILGRTARRFQEEVGSVATRSPASGLELRSTRTVSAERSAAAVPRAQGYDVAGNHPLRTSRC
jgi:hypothetical protein